MLNLTRKFCIPPTIVPDSLAVRSAGLRLLVPEPSASRPSWEELLKIIQFSGEDEGPIFLRGECVCVCCEGGEGSMKAAWIGVPSVSRRFNGLCTIIICRLTHCCLL